MRPADDLPTPACRLGYTSAQVLGILGVERTARLNRWLNKRGTERPVCDGRSSRGPHGAVAAAADLESFRAGERR